MRVTTPRPTRAARAIDFHGYVIHRLALARVDGFRTEQHEAA
jgi:hypothetical protein